MLCVYVSSAIWPFFFSLFTHLLHTPNTPRRARSSQSASARTRARFHPCRQSSCSILEKHSRAFEHTTVGRITALPGPALHQSGVAAAGECNQGAEPIAVWGGEGQPIAAGARE